MKTFRLGTPTKDIAAYLESNPSESVHVESKNCWWIVSKSDIPGLYKRKMSETFKFSTTLET